MCEELHFHAIQSELSDTFSDQSPTLTQESLMTSMPSPSFEESKSPLEMQFVNEEEAEVLGAAAPIIPTSEEAKTLPTTVASAAAVAAASKTDSPSRKKGVRLG